MKQTLQKLPKGFPEKLELILGQRLFKQVVPRFEKQTPTTFRVNTLKSSVDDVRRKLTFQGFKLKPVDWNPLAFILTEGKLRHLQETETYKSGHIYVQGLSSMVPPLVLKPEPGETILDMTAAPGGKTTQMAAMMEEEGELVGNDNNKIRFFKMKANVEMQGATNVKLTMFFGEGFGKKQPETYDRVLLDAPCSSEGRFLVNKPSTFGYWKEMKVKELSRKQKKLMFSALQTLKVGGQLVYSTCTFSPEENESILQWALLKFGDAIEIEPIDLNFPNISKGLKEWKGKSYDPRVARGLRILPNDTMEGFFVASIRKVKPTTEV